MDRSGFLHGAIPEPIEPPADELVSAQDVITDPTECRALVVRGRPPFERTTDIVAAICDMLREGKSVRVIGKIEGMPSTATIRRWIEDDEDFRRAYLRAKESFCDDQLEEILEVAADYSHDTVLVESAEGLPTVQVDKVTIGRAKLNIDTKFKVIAKMEPRKYGKPAESAPPVEPARNGDDARIIEGTTIPLEDHPLYDSILAWGKVAEEAKQK